jgi:galactokinase
MTLKTKCHHLFRELFNKEPLLFAAPGRINLIGEHTDYNEGFVLPAAVDKQIIFAVAPNDTGQYNIYSADFNESVSFSAATLAPGNGWANYLMGVVDGLLDRGVRPGGVDCGVRPGGVDCVIGGDIPTGAGMSSSAALCSGFGFALNGIFSLGLSRLDLALIGQRAEHRFAGVRCGIMDQYASLFGKKDAAILLDCRSLTHEYIPVHLKDYQLLLIDTCVKHALASSAYNDRRLACEEGVRAIQKVNPSVHALRDASMQDLIGIQSSLAPGVFARCQFIIEEIERARTAAEWLAQGDVAGFGKAMYQTHWGLSKHYEVSCDESDFLVRLAEAHPAVIAGARMMGGGFGGCVILLIRKEAVREFSAKVVDKYVATFKKEPDFYSVNISDGVHPINL